MDTGEIKMRIAVLSGKGGTGKTLVSVNLAAVAEQAGLKKVDAEKAIEAFTAVVEGALKAGDKVQLVGFGTFEV